MADQADATASSPGPLPPTSTTGKADADARAEYYAKFFHSTPSDIPGPFAQLLEQYSGIPPSSQSAHIIRTRDLAYKHHPFPCLGRFRFLELDLSTHPLYHTDVLPLLTSSTDSVFLDIGCCLGQDLRKLIHDGVPASRVYGADLQWNFIDASYDLFADEQRLPRSHFLVPGDVLSADNNDDNKSNALARLDQACDIVNLNAVFHLFDLPTQRRVAARTLRLLRPDPNSRKLVLGMHLGMEEPTPEHRPDGGDKFRHNMRSWTELWDGVLTEDPRAKKCEVGGYLLKRVMRDGGGGGSSNSTRPLTTGDDGSGSGTAAAAVGGGGDAGSGQAPESLYRWQVWWVWVDF